MGNNDGARIWYDPPPPGPWPGARVAPALQLSIVSRRLVQNASVLCIFGKSDFLLIASHGV
eukprot:scaffold10468_cov103-Isochrysis_galbana.AAC.2